MNNTFFFAIKHRMGREGSCGCGCDEGSCDEDGRGSDAITSVHSPLMGSAARYFFRSSVVTRID